MYSVEWIPKSDPNNCWNQFALTRTKIGAKVLRFNFRLGFGKDRRLYDYRIRKVS